MKLKILLSLVIILFSLNLIYAQPDATVDSVKGNALVKKRADKKPKSLKKGDELFEEDQVQCGKGCRALNILLCNTSIPIPIEKNRWITITASYCGAFEESRAGRSKGDGVTITSPQDSETIQPENFSLKWKPTGSSVKFNLVLKVFHGEDLLPINDIDASKGYFNSDSLKKELKKAQEKGSLVLMIVLTESRKENDADQEPQRVKFKLISRDNQRELDNKLKTFESETDEVVKYTKRGSTFAKYELFSQAVENLEKALQISKSRQSETLKAVTYLAIMANYHAYNDERVKELCSSLTNLNTRPSVCDENKR